MSKINTRFHFITALLVAMLAAMSFAFSASYKTEAVSPPICDSLQIPELNKKIVEYIKGQVRYKVGQGEAWDLAAEALNAVEAKWDNEYKFGKLVDYKNECVFPGDIIYMQNVRIEYKDGRTLYTEKLPEHIAIVYEVEEAEDYTVAEQNTGRLGQKVGLTPLALKNIKSGKIKIYRPQPK